MKIGEAIFFCGKKSFKDLLEIDDDREWYGLFFQRLEESYLKPADELNNSKHGFAALAIVFSAIEYVAVIHHDQKGPGDKAIAALTECGCFPKDMVGRIYGAYRCGIVHEGKISAGMAASYEIGNVFFAGESGGIFIINPERFLAQIRVWIGRLSNCSDEKKRLLGGKVRMHHKRDLEIANM